jgi:hypothetical protein
MRQKMPPSDHIQQDTKARVLIYGPEKSKKTWWACKAAEHGFNVILCDADDGAHIVNKETIPDIEARKRIQVLNIVDDYARPVAAEFVAKMISGQPFFYDETARRWAMIQGQADHAYYRIDPKKLTTNDVLILDSWTAVAQSVMQRAANDADVELEEMKKQEGRDLYGYANTFLNTALARLHAFPCHLVVIGHSNVYEKYDNSNPKSPKLISQRTQPISSTGPHGMKLGKHFSDVLLSEFIGTNVRFDLQASATKACGSRLIKPGTYMWDELQFIDILNKHGIPTPDESKPCEGFLWLPPGETWQRPEGDKVVGKTNNAPAQQPLTGGKTGGLKLLQK